MDHAKQAIRKENQVILVEGYFDQMRAVQHGLEHVVATCGTALTSKQAKILRNHAETAILKNFYKKQDKFYGVDGVGTIQEITDRLSAVIDELMEK